MLAMMEGQLGRLSVIIRTREAEVTQLRQAVQDGCAERKELLMLLEQAQQGAQQGGGGGPGTPTSSPGQGQRGEWGEAGSTGGGPTSPNSLRGAGGIHKPYRTGLPSKPKFR